VIIATEGLYLAGVTSPKNATQAKAQPTANWNRRII
jgi:hypothetical protein